MNTIDYRKEYQKVRANKDELLDLNFIGCYKRDSDNTIIKKGFIELTHGDKENIKNFIESQVKIAEDGQAIYEFLQNAVDANSTTFSVYYDDENFLVINNGKKFNFDNTKSILNFSQSTKTEEDEKIGKFGVGFKLIHRLVGNDSGIDQIIEQYKGPILFSWDDFYIEKLLQNDFQDIDKHWLYKIIYTNFPCGVDEKIKNEQYQPIKPFVKSDLNNMIYFINSQNINLEELKSGSLFFLKLGKEKKEVLDLEQEDLKSGISTSLNILNHLRKQKQGINSITINNSNIKSDNLHLLSNGKYIFLYPPLKYAEAYYKTIDEKISFFKFFPMGDQTNKLNFIIHHYKFEVETNRRKLQKNGSINQRILSDIWGDLRLKLDHFLKEKKEEFVDIIASLYLSDLKNANNKDILIINNFTNYALQYITVNIPYKYTNSYGIDSFNTTNDKSKIIIIDSILDDIPLRNRCHFYFDPKKYKDIVREACSKIKLTRWNIIDVMINDDINNWILKLNDNNFSKLLQEIDDKKKHYSKAIVDIWKDIYTLDEIRKILQIFSRLDNIKFAISKNEKNSYSVIFNSHNHYIKNSIFKEFLSEYDLESIEYYLIPDELEDQILNIIGKKSSDKEILDYFLQIKQHTEVIEFIEHYDMEEIFLNTLSRLDLDISKKYDSHSFEHKVIDMILNQSDNENILQNVKQKIFVNDNPIDDNMISRYITFKNGDIDLIKINPKEYKHLKYNSEIYEIVDCFEKIDKHLLSHTIFKNKELSKENIYDNIHTFLHQFSGKINSYAKLKFLVLYSIESKKEFISNFNGWLLWDREINSENSEKSFELLSKLLKSLNSEELKIFNISSFFPQTLRKDYYIKDRSLAIKDEELPDNIEDKYIEVFEKVGLKIESNLLLLRKKLINKEKIDSDEISKFTQQKLINTLKFLQVIQGEYCISNNEIENIKKLFQKIDTDNKKALEYFPVLQTKESICFKRVDKYTPNKSYIKKETLKSTNKVFQKRLDNEIKNENIIYIELLNLDTIPSTWSEIKENEEEKNIIALESINQEKIQIDKQLSQKSEYNDYTAEIGRKGELLVKEKLIEKFGIDRVVDNNEVGENKKIDFEILDKDLKSIIHKVEVKATIKEANEVKNNSVAFYMGSEQYKYAQKYDNNTHLVFVTGVDTNEPEFLYMNFDNSWISGLE